MSGRRRCLRRAPPSGSVSAVWGLDNDSACPPIPTDSQLGFGRFLVQQPKLVRLGVGRKVSGCPRQRPAKTSGRSMLPASCSARLHGWQQSAEVASFEMRAVETSPSRWPRGRGPPGTARPEKKAKGADEFSAEPVTARFLSATDVGPNVPERCAAAVAVLGPIIPRGCRQPS